MQITNGTVSFEDGIPAKTGDFDPKRKVRVELSFAVEEGGDGAIAAQKVGAIARAEVGRLLDKEVTATEVLVSQGKAVDLKPVATGKKAAVKPAEAPKAPERTKADIEKEHLESLSAAPAAKPAAPAEDELGDMLGEAAPVPVTDKEISDACIGKADHMKTVAGWEPKKIRLLVEEFVGHTGAKFAQVPAEKRHEFLKRLAELK